MVSVPNRTSYELHLSAKMSDLYSALELQRRLSGRSADACLWAATRTVGAAESNSWVVTGGLAGTS